MKNREWVHKKGMHSGELTSIQKRKAGEKREEIYILKQINIYSHFEICTTSQ